MNSKYLDIMELAVSAYSGAQIADYINEVKQNGLTEHGFPRLASNLGILIANGRKLELKNTFTEMMNICCESIPKVKAANDFSVREICCCLQLLEEKNTIDKQIISKWKEQLRSFKPSDCYTDVVNHEDEYHANWALFAAVSEFVRAKYLNLDSMEFIERQLAPQMRNFDMNYMYKDPHCPIVYDLVSRLLFAFLIKVGYIGKYKDRILTCLNKTANITLKMQSVTGEIPFGGRSNQFVLNEALLISYYEIEAIRFSENGNFEMANELKSAAKLALNNLLYHLNLKPIGHIKNRYDINSLIGCEGYGYFNKYMVTVASNIYIGAMFTDNTETEYNLQNKNKPYVYSTSFDFHKTFVNAGNYFLEFETEADTLYDSNGLGRIHKKDCPSAICLSVPFSPEPNYVIEDENPRGMSICCFAEKDDKTLYGSKPYAEYNLKENVCGEDFARIIFECSMMPDVQVTEEYFVSQNGVDITLLGYENCGFMIPVFEFDGQTNTEINISENYVSVKYQNSLCKYIFNGDIDYNYGLYYNRNGRYRVYKIHSKNLHIEITN